jgi:tetratricopeptide (TPR) repeat protein
MVASHLLPSQRGLREQLRGASEALSRAAQLAEEQSGVKALHGDAQLQQAVLHVKQSLLQSARKHLALAAAATLRITDAVGLPVLPSAPSDDAEDTLGAAQRALGAAWSNLAELETLRGDTHASIAAYRKALEISPDDVTAHAQLASLLESHHDLAEAKTHAERALKADPANMAAGAALATTCASSAQAQRPSAGA